MLLLDIKKTCLSSETVSVSIYSVHGVFWMSFCFLPSRVKYRKHKKKIIDDFLPYLEAFMFVGSKVFIFIFMLLPLYRKDNLHDRPKY